VLDYGWIVRKTSLQSGLRLGWFADTDVLNVGPAEDDVLVHLVPGCHGSVSWSILSTERSDFGQSDRGHLGVDGVEDTLIPDLRFGDQADLGPQVGDSCRHC